MSLVKRYPMLGSSVDPEKLSLTIKSMGIMLIPIIVAIGKMFDLALAEADLTELVSAVASIVSLTGVIYGIGRKYIK